MSQVMFEVGAAVVGACIGSFLNVVIHRLPQEDPARRSLGGRSRCPTCGAQIAWHDNLPVVGWLLLRGRARCCRQRISVRYPLVEALTAALFFCAAHWPHSGSPFDEDADFWPRMFAAAFDMLFLAFLVASTFIDWDHRILPDALNIPCSVIGCTLVPFAAPGYAGSLDPTISAGLDSLLASLVGFGTGFGLTWAIRAGARAVFRKEAMGFGDVKFMGAIGAFVGWDGALLTFFLGCVVGAAGGVLHRIVTRDAYVPFGPFLAAGAVLTLFFKETLFEFLFQTWPEWQRSSPAAKWLLAGGALLCILALVVIIRRGRGR